MDDNVRLPLWAVDDFARRLILDQLDFKTLCVLAGVSEHCRTAIIERARASCRSCEWTLIEDGSFTIDFVPNRQDETRSRRVTSADLGRDDMDVFATDILQAFEIEWCNVEITARKDIHHNFLFRAISVLEPQVKFDTVKIFPEFEHAANWNYEDLHTFLESLVCTTLITYEMNDRIKYEEHVNIDNVIINDRLWLSEKGLRRLRVQNIDITLGRNNYEFNWSSAVTVIKAWNSGRLSRLKRFSCTFIHDPAQFSSIDDVLNGIEVLNDDDDAVYPDPPLVHAHRIICRKLDNKYAFIGFKSPISEDKQEFLLLPWFPKNKKRLIYNTHPEGSSDEEPAPFKQIQYDDEDSIDVPTCSNVGHEDPIEANLDDEDSPVLNNAAESSSNSNKKKRKRTSNEADDSTEQNTSTEEPMNVNYPAEKPQHPDDDQDGPGHGPNPAKKRRV